MSPDPSYFGAAQAEHLQAVRACNRPIIREPSVVTQIRRMRGENSPDISNDIRRVAHLGYMNIFRYRAGKGREVFPDPLRPNLWGTETLGGDWKGRLLVVLKEFAPLHDLEERTRPVKTADVRIRRLEHLSTVVLGQAFDGETR
ncbi:hypothetical protein EB232_21310 [Mesorhizobium sp. NZP2077]|nr:hypothetical protein EB232_21310 [Mesorhizobium sp. NZP2077]